MEDTPIINQYSVILSGMLLTMLTFLWSKGKELFGEWQSRRRKNPVLIAKKDSLIDDLLVKIRFDFKADSASLWQKDTPTLDQVRYSVTHERAESKAPTFREESQHVLQYDMNDVFIKLQEQKVVQVQVEQVPEDWKINGIMHHRGLHDILLALISDKEQILGFIWISYHYHNLPDMSESDKLKLKEYARQMAYRLTQY